MANRAITAGIQAGLVSKGLSRGRQQADREIHRNTVDKQARSITPNVPHPGRTAPVRWARRLNNGNMPGHGVGGVPGNGFGLPSALSLGRFGLKHHHAMTSGKIGPTHLGASGSGGAPTPKIKAPPLFKPFKPLPTRKIPNFAIQKQPKPKTSTALPPLGSAPTTRPKFAPNK
jgi:hypothetical protein